MEYSFNLYNSLAVGGVTVALKKLLPDPSALPIVVCVGSDLSVGDSLGPVTGTKLVQKLHGLNAFVYGTLSKPVTAHEVKYIGDFLSRTHPQTPVIAVDAAVGVAGDIGLIKLCSRALSPGSGANKKLKRVGNISVMGIVAEKSAFNYSLFSTTRLNFIDKMSDIIAEGIAAYLFDRVAAINAVQSAEQALSAAHTATAEE